MEGSFLDQLAELGWGLEVFIVVTATLVVRYVSMRLLKVLGRHLSKTANVWDDALLEAAYKPLSYFILIFGMPHLRGGVWVSRCWSARRPKCRRNRGAHLCWSSARVR